MSCSITVPPSEIGSSCNKYYVGLPPAPVTPDEINQIREITIREVNRGYIVSAGCHTFAIETAANLIAKLSAYISNPAETEKKWFNKELF